MKEFPQQGDIIKIENVRFPVLVVSKDFFNRTGEIIGCPFFVQGDSGPLHIPVKTESMNGFVHCEKLKLLDLNVRGFSFLDRIHMTDIIDITDAIQSIFEYV